MAIGKKFKTRERLVDTSGESKLELFTPMTGGKSFRVIFDTPFRNLTVPIQVDMQKSSTEFSRSGD